MIELTEAQKALVDEMEAIDEQSRYWNFRAKESAGAGLKDLINERADYDIQQLIERRPEPPGGDSVDVREDQGIGGA